MLNTIIHSFFSAPDFTIMFDDKMTDMGVFRLLELACIQFCKISFQTRQSHHTQKKPPPKILHERFIYNTMVWGMFLLQYDFLKLISLSLQYHCP